VAASSLDRLGALPRRRALPFVATGVAIVLLLGALGIYLYDHSRRDVISNGVRVDGISVGGLHEAAARRKVAAALSSRFNHPVTVHWGGRTWQLSAREAAVHADVANMVAQAVNASREGSILTRAARGLFGGSLNRNVALEVTYSHQAVQALAAKIRGELDRAPQDATVQPSGSSLHPVPGRVGLAVEYAALGSGIAHALMGPGPSLTVGVPVHKIQPKVTTAQLAASYPAYIVIDRGSFRLRFYNHLKLSKTFEIAVGMEGLETPAGLHHIEWEQVNPPWYVPKKAWAGALAGTVVPPGPADPLKARFMSFEGGAGIHGIDPGEYSTIGHDASHGCVRMRIPDVIDLYSHSPVGTPVYII
jgi:lipoprotein-anchoring transpeptidase ErfK/SrfK